MALLLVFSAEGALAGAPAPRPDTGEAHTPEHQLASLGKFKFENGETIDDLKVSYVTHGKLNAAHDNVILALQHFVGDHHDLDFLIGPGKALDPDKYFIVATDFLGNARLRSPLTTGPTNSGLKMAFPRITARDWVSADYKLVKEYLGIDRVVAAIGASIGAINAYQLAVSYPDFPAAIIPIAGSPKTNPQTQRVLRHARDVLALDPGWYGGMYESNPETGLEVAASELEPWWYSYEWFAENLTTPGAVRGFELQWHKIWSEQLHQDARDFYYQLQGWAEFNLGDTPGFNGDVDAALRSIKAKTLLIGASSDMLVRREEILSAKQALRDATFLEIQSPLGHLIAVGADAQATDTMNREIKKFLASTK
ncbi:MAG TPA: alpha/beta fold hydrolase [Stellaceae bacterium]|nr:alpha/beta fold hydrolase [Stellaceae bacterium]